MIRVLTVRSKRLLSFLFEKICNVAAVFEKQKIKQKSQINILETKQLKYWKKKNGSKCHNTCQASLFGNILQSAETLNGAFDSDN